MPTNIDSSKSAELQLVDDLWLKPLPEKCPDAEFYLVRIFLYSVRVQENTDQKMRTRKNSVFGHFHAVNRTQCKTKCNVLVLKGTLMQIWKSSYIFGIAPL